MINYCSVTGVYRSELDAVNAVAGEMVSMTDELNLEHSAVIYTIKAFGNEYHLTGGIVAGNYDNVIPAAILSSPFIEDISSVKGLKILGSLFNFSIGKTLIHTHPRDADESNRFSGSPGSLKKGGDAAVVDYLGYESIYLVGSDGNLYKYEGMGTGTNQAETKDDMNALKDYPVSTNMPQSEIVYLYNDMTDKFEIPVYR